MVDVHDTARRSFNMSRIQGKNTKPELVIRRGLHQMGFRYRLHVKNLPGRPDMVLAKYRAIILINGCFWHRHNCHLFKWPETRAEFWKAKIESNVNRDNRNLNVYRAKGWKVLIIWECAMKGRSRRDLAEVIQTAANWLQYDIQCAEIEGLRGKLS